MRPSDYLFMSTGAAPPRRSRREPKRRPGGRGAMVAVILAVSAAALGLLGTVGVARAYSAYQSFTRDLPSVAGVGNRPLFKTTRVLDRNGQLIYELFDPDKGKRTVVHVQDLPPRMIEAVLAVEDATFYENPGVEVRGILRALFQDVTSGTIVSGGSTITQQLIRNVLLSSEERTSNTLSRKLKEAVLAVELSRSYTKQQILEMYLNEIYFGNLSYGIDTAAHTYFGKDPKELSLAQCALIAGLPQAPSRYDPFRNFDGAKTRQEEVLGLMVRHGYIRPAEAEAAKREPLQFTSPDEDVAINRYPHWATYVRTVLEDWYGAKELLGAGLIVYTTLDSRLQDLAQDSVTSHVRDLAAQNATNAALVAIDPKTGEILSMVGSPDFNDASIDGQVNGAIVERQPGSSIKPIVYATAFLKGFAPATVVVDEPIAIPDGTQVWRPQNYDNKFRGPITLRQALGSSFNIPAVKVLQFVGLPNALEQAKKMGMTSLRDPQAYGPSFVLGGGEVRLVELASAYSVLADQGVAVPPSPILKVLDGDGRTIYEHQPEPKPVLDPRAAWLVTSILSDNNARLETFGANSSLRLAGGRAAAAKTGSTDDYRDAWTVGYTPSLVAGVWVGRADNKPMRLVVGSSSAGKIWNSFMEGALEDQPVESFPPAPEGVVQATVCATTGFPDTADCPRTVTDWFMKDRVPTVGRRAFAVDRVNGKLAGPNTPYQDVVLQMMNERVSGEGPFPPTEYSERTGGGRPWEGVNVPSVPTAPPSQQNRAPTAAAQPPAPLAGQPSSGAPPPR